MKKTTITAEQIAGAENSGVQFNLVVCVRVAACNHGCNFGVFLDRAGVRGLPNSLLQILALFGPLPDRPVSLVLPGDLHLHPPPHIPPATLEMF